MTKLNILIIDRSLKTDREYLFKSYGGKYDLIILPQIAGCIKIIFSKYDLISSLEILFPSFKIDYHLIGNEYFFDLDLVGTHEDVLYKELNKEFEINQFKLTDIEIAAT